MSPVVPSSAFVEAAADPFLHRAVLILATSASGLKYMSELRDVAKAVLPEPKK